MTNIINKINFEKQIQKINLKIKEQKISKKSIKKNLIIYVKGLKNFNLLNKKYLSKWSGKSNKLLNIILPPKEKIIIKKQKKLTLLEKMQHRIQLNKINNKNFKNDLILHSNLFLDYLIFACGGARACSATGGRARKK